MLQTPCPRGRKKLGHGNTSLIRAQIFRAPQTCNRDPDIIHLIIALRMVASLYFGGESHVSNGQNVSSKKFCVNSRATTSSHPTPAQPTPPHPHPTPPHPTPTPPHPTPPPPHPTPPPTPPHAAPPLPSATSRFAPPGPRHLRVSGLARGRGAPARRGRRARRHARGFPCKSALRFMDEILGNDLVIVYVHYFYVSQSTLLYLFIHLLVCFI